MFHLLNLSLLAFTLATTPDFSQYSQADDDEGPMVDQTDASDVKDWRTEGRYPLSDYTRRLLRNYRADESRFPSEAAFVESSTKASNDGMDFDADRHDVEGSIFGRGNVRGHNFVGSQSLSPDDDQFSRFGSGHNRLDRLGLDDRDSSSASLLHTYDSMGNDVPEEMQEPHADRGDVDLQPESLIALLTNATRNKALLNLVLDASNNATAVHEAKTHPSSFLQEKSSLVNPLLLILSMSRFLSHLPPPMSLDDEEGIERGRREKIDPENLDSSGESEETEKGHYHREKAVAEDEDGELGKLIMQVKHLAKDLRVLTALEKFQAALRRLKEEKARSVVTNKQMDRQERTPVEAAQKPRQSITAARTSGNKSGPEGMADAVGTVMKLAKKFGLHSGAETEGRREDDKEREDDPFSLVMQRVSVPRRGVEFRVAKRKRPLRLAANSDLPWEEDEFRKAKHADG